MNQTIRLFCVLLCLPLPTATLAQNTAEPLSKIVKTPVTPCGAMKTIPLPVITWGGDIATILANGGATTTNDSLFGKSGLSFDIKREDVFAKQLENYLACQTPFIRGTLGMMHMASTITEQNPATKLHIIYQMTWSAGGDALVVKGGIKNPRHLKGKTIALQAYGPHVDYLGKVLGDAGLSLKDVNLKWVKDLTGSATAPAAAFKAQGIDAAMVIIPDALALTSNGTVGTGAEDSVKDARILLSTRSADHIIADVYAVRADFLAANRDLVGKFVKDLMTAAQELQTLAKAKSPEYNRNLKIAAKILLDSEQALADTEGLYADARFVGWDGNKKFFASKTYPRRFEKLNQEIGNNIKAIGMSSTITQLAGGNWNYEELNKGQFQAAAPKARFNEDRVANIVREKDRLGTLDDGALFTFEVFFKPNQNEFSEAQYADDFKKVVDLASTYGGAIITVEGHSDPLGYLKKKKAGANNVVLQKVRQAAKNLSLTRANRVRDAIISYGQNKGVNLDKTQFAVIGQGLAKPASGMCGVDPCAPKTKEQWLENMRVQFKIIQVEAEESAFSPI